MESLPLNPTCQGRCEVNTLSSDMKYCFEKSLCSDSYTLVMSTVVFPLLLLGVLKQMFHKPWRELCENIATNGRGWLAATPGKLISEKNVANCNRLGLLLVSAVVAFFFWNSVVAFLIPRSFVVLFFKLSKLCGSSVFSMTSKFGR